ncbi:MULTISPECIES: hypothetical protein [unclassified Paenibacillus]|uniref:hypothetical protein n=1 Tax=unclassified Paenibacillus TaxID=185978 RepID=UPI00363C4D66
MKWSWTHYEEYSSLLEQFNKEQYLILEGGGDFTLYFGKHLCQLYHTVRWKKFLSDSDLRESIRNLCFQLYPILGEGIYVPDEYCIDDLLHEGKNFNDIKDLLFTRFGNSVVTFKELLWQYENEQTDWGYYLESFEDIIRK